MVVAAAAVAATSPNTLGFVAAAAAGGGTGGGGGECGGGIIMGLGNINAFGGGAEGPHASPLMVAEGALTPLCRGHPVRKKGLKIRIEMGVEVEGRGEEGGGKHTL